MQQETKVVDAALCTTDPVAQRSLCVPGTATSAWFCNVTTLSRSRKPDYRVSPPLWGGVSGAA